MKIEIGQQKIMPNQLAICQIKQYVQDIDAEVITNLLPNLNLKTQKNN